MSKFFSPQIDPEVVLGVPSGASIAMIREAYRAKAKKLHPDVGGEEWAFRILSQAYELLCVARVVNAAERDVPRDRPAETQHQPPPPPPPPGGAAGFKARTADRVETLRPGVRESAFHPTQVVEVEKLTVRYEADHVWLVTEHASDQRLLSCSLNLTWPDTDLQEPPESISNAEPILAALAQVFDAVQGETRPASSWSAVSDGRFVAWLSYPSGETATTAIEILRRRLHDVGMVVDQWSRDLIVPRQAKS